MECPDIQLSWDSHYPPQSLGSLETPIAYRQEWTSLLSKLTDFWREEVYQSSTKTKMLEEEVALLNDRLSVLQGDSLDIPNGEMEEIGLHGGPEGGEPSLERIHVEATDRLNPVLEFNTETVAGSINISPRSKGSRSSEEKSEQLGDFPCNQSDCAGKCKDCCSCEALELVEILEKENKILMEDLKNTINTYESENLNLRKEIVSLERKLKKVKRSHKGELEEMRKRQRDLESCTENRLCEAYRNIKTKEEALAEQSWCHEQMREKSESRARSIQEKYESRILNLEQEIQGLEEENIKLTETLKQQEKLISHLQSTMEDKNKISKCHFY